jgi:hypothetical protein
MKTRRPRADAKTSRGKNRGGLAGGPPARTDHPRLKRRGGQLGNQNALKHGFYSTLFKERERRLLEQMQPADLSAEIELIRVTSARFLEALAASREPGDFEANLTALRLVNLSAQSIAMLLRAQALSGSLRKDMDEAIKALEELDEKLNITGDPKDPSPESLSPVPTS